MSVYTSILPSAFVFVISHNSHSNCEAGILTPILQVKDVTFREFKSFILTTR